MRIADKMNFDQVKHNLGKNRADMADLQNQAATQKRVNKPSDDPLASARILSTRTDIHGNSQFLKNISQAKAFLEYSEQSLGELTETLVRAKELALSQANDASANESSRRVAASEIRQLIEQAVQIGNRKLGDRFLFGGYRTTRPPFGPDGRYFGDSGEMKILIDKQAFVAMNVPGEKVFLGRTADAANPQEPSPAEGDPSAQGAELRGPASLQQKDTSQPNNLGASWQSGTNIFNVLEGLEINLLTNDKAGVQESLDKVDQAMAQVILSRAQLGSRLTTLNSSMESLQKNQLEAKTMVSSLEDADAFELINDLNKTENTLQASLATSSKLIQPSLLDFLR